MEIKLNIPEYLSLRQWKLFNSMEHLSPGDKMVKMISLLSDKTEDEVKTWTPASIQDAYGAILDVLSDLNPAFFPVFELDNQLYGYSSMSKMTLGEYVDLERLAKNPTENLEEIMAILYRPITKNKFGGIKWAFKNTFKVKMGDAENLFQYYELEEYNSNERKANADKLSVIPATMALGAMSFFLVLASTSLLSSNLSSLPPKEQMKMEKQISKQITSMNIGDGLAQFITSLKHPSFQSPEIVASLN